MGSDADLTDSDSGSEADVQMDSTPARGAGPSRQSKVTAKPSGSKGIKKGNGKEVSPPNSEDDTEAKPGDRQGTTSKGGLKGSTGKEEDEDDEDNMELEMGKYHTVDPDKMRAVLATLTPEQMSRYECYRRSGFQRANMRRLIIGDHPLKGWLALTNENKGWRNGERDFASKWTWLLFETQLLQTVSGGPVSVPMTIVISGIAKMFVGELVEIGRIVMTERDETGPIRPCHIREAYRRLKLEGKVPMRGRPVSFGSSGIVTS